VLRQPYKITAIHASWTIWTDLQPIT